MMYKLSYGTLSKYWLTIVTSLVAISFIIIVELFFYSWIEIIKYPQYLPLILIPFIFNIYLDLSNFKKIHSVNVNDHHINYQNLDIAWSSIINYTRFGPTISGERPSIDIALLHCAGIIIQSNNKQFPIYATAKNYKKLLSQLKNNNVPCSNA